MNIPCKNCITFAICKQQTIVYRNDNHRRFDISLCKLIGKCSILVDYLSQRRDTVITKSDGKVTSFVIGFITFKGMYRLFRGVPWRRRNDTM